MDHFAVITGDIIDSKKYPDNLEELKKERLNQIPASGLYTQFRVSRGDEIQGVCDNLSLLPVIIRNLRYICRPLNVRLGIGIGSIIDPKPGQNSWDMNGKAFVLARGALDSIKKNKAPQTILLSEDPLFDQVFNVVYSLVDTVMNGWTHSQWEAVQAYEADRTLVKAAGALKIAWQNVQKRCQAAKWDVIKKAEQNMAVLFETMFMNK